MAIAWKGTVTQYAGRLNRSHPGKRDVLIYDYVDAEVTVLRRMFAKCLRTYRTLGYELPRREQVAWLSRARVRCGGHDSGVSQPMDRTLAKLKVPVELRPRVSEILAITGEVSAAHLDEEYGELCSVLVGRLARKRPSPLARGGTRIWAAGAIYAVGRVNFLFDPSQQPHLSGDQLARCVGVVKTTMANKAALIVKALNIGIFESDLTRVAMLEQHPLTWMVMVNGFIVDARTLPPEIQDEARRRGVIPDLEARRAA
jgi:hypothetical protein